jgi:hypothetical protein
MVSRKVHLERIIQRTIPAPQMQPRALLILRYHLCSIPGSLSVNGGGFDSDLNRGYKLSR